MRLGSFRAALLVAPLVLMVLAGSVAPLGVLLWRGLAETEVEPALPRTLRALRLWDGRGLPDDAAFEALAADLAALQSAGPEGAAALERAADRLGAEVPALREALPGTAARAPATITSRATSVLVADPVWGETESWAALRRAAPPVSGFHLLSALGLRQGADGGLEDAEGGPHDRARLTRGIGGAALAVLAGLPLAWALARLIAETSSRRAALLAGLALLPLLAGETGRAAGVSLLSEPGPVAALAALLLGAVPLIALPVALSLRRAGPRLPRAAAALGARPGRVLLSVGLPLARRGLALGCALAFAQALGSELLNPAAPGAASALAAAAGVGQWGEAGATAFWLLLPTVLAVLLLLHWGRRA
ncbi:ABC transporter permease [Roseomonas sp. GCM10028921]